MCEVILTLLRYKDTRSRMVELLARFLEANTRRSQIQTEEEKVAGDGFMLNILYCLHELSIDKIPVEKVSVVRLAFACTYWL